jgi:hypothetical protein
MSIESVRSPYLITLPSDIIANDLKRLRSQVSLDSSKTLGSELDDDCPIEIMTTDPTLSEYLITVPAPHPAFVNGLKRARTLRLDNDSKFDYQAKQIESIPTNLEFDLIDDNHQVDKSTTYSEQNIYVPTIRKISTGTDIKPTDSIDLTVDLPKIRTNNNYICKLCGDKVLRIDKQYHNTYNCPHTTVECPDCLRYYKRYEMVTHKNTCMYRLKTCSYCALEMKKIHVVAHEFKCDFKKVWCKHCFNFMERWCLPEHETFCKFK